MPKLDITKNDIPITEYLDCHRGFLTRRFIPYQGKRNSDAYVFILDGSCRYKFDDGVEFEAKKDGILYLAKNAEYEMDINCDRFLRCKLQLYDGRASPKRVLLSSLSLLGRTSVFEAFLHPRRKNLVQPKHGNALPDHLRNIGKQGACLYRKRSKSKNRKLCRLYSFEFFRQPPFGRKARGGRGLQ